ncbi:hypothetical protein [Microbacterium hydrocarbonoxydans]|uniref:hypothetical protein n=1 Tax=Microbacterium hydrocarbonoxydans TaxID=273678 RepID=UPI0007BBD874|nr:hypothetical protein [Microbacterium hydrocarbonoxydans]GAT73872.1 hypothetical protein MHM582_2367 [Microbacterium sp. HM58-2]
MTGWRKVIAGLAGALVLLGAAVVPPTQTTEAAFTDAEHATATFAATTLETPVITSCTPQTLNVIGVGLVFQSVTLVWTAPYPVAGVKLTATSGANTGTVPASNISTSGPVNGTYTHTAVLSQALLTSLVTNLLGSTTTLAVTSVAGTSWTSPAATRRLTIALLGLNPTCTV